MLRYLHLDHRFVHFIPEQLEPGLIYISLDYATAAHSCCCGCGEQVITPFSPNDWKLTFDGETVSLWPSIGNWKFPCRSHYIIRNGQILQAESWEEWQERKASGRDSKTQETFWVAEGEKHEESLSFWERLISDRRRRD